MKTSPRSSGESWKEKGEKRRVAPQEKVESWKVKGERWKTSRCSSGKSWKDKGERGRRWCSSFQWGSFQFSVLGRWKGGEPQSQSQCYWVKLWLSFRRRKVDTAWRERSEGKRHEKHGNLMRNQHDETCWNREWALIYTNEARDATKYAIPAQVLRIKLMVKCIYSINVQLNRPPSPKKQFLSNVKW